MKKLTAFLLFFSLFSAANAQQPSNLTTGPNITLTNNVLDANLKTVRDSILLAIQRAAAASTAAAGANTTATNAANLSTANTTAIKGVSDTGKANTAAIKVVQDQINNLTPAGIKKPIIVTSNYTVADSCHLRTIDVQCNGCIVYFPNNVTPGLKFWVNNESIGTIYIKKAITNGASFQSKYAQSISVGARPLFADYKTSSFLNIR